jgi:chlorite dismutase
VRAKTVASFALNDYKWMLAFAADELHWIVDLMRDLRGSGAPSARPRGDPVLHRPPPLDE